MCIRDRFLTDWLQNFFKTGIGEVDRLFFRQNLSHIFHKLYFLTAFQRPVAVILSLGLKNLVLIIDRDSVFLIGVDKAAQPMPSERIHCFQSTLLADRFSGNDFFPLKIIEKNPVCENSRCCLLYTSVIGNGFHALG